MPSPTYLHGVAERRSVGADHREPDLPEPWAVGRAREHPDLLPGLGDGGAVLGELIRLVAERHEPVGRVGCLLAEPLLAEELHVLVDRDHPVEVEVVRRALVRLVVVVGDDEAGLNPEDLDRLGAEAGGTRADDGVPDLLGVRRVRQGSS